ncbi:hypothetical protein DIPPA_29971 [Diplonema papillatum]|nr:hypothetical protein DIPPA_29971 [Diplonema papillatum]
MNRLLVFVFAISALFDTGVGMNRTDCSPLANTIIPTMLSIPIHCPDGYGMRGWRFRSEMGQEGFFEFECVPILPSACELLRSSCELFTNLTTFVDALANWARPCGPNRYFRGWLLAVCSSSGVTVRNTCCDLPSGWTARNKQMPVRVPGAEASVARMDAWDTKRLGPMCPPSSVMMGWERDYLSASGDVGLTYSCASEPSGLCTLGTLPPPSAGVAIGRTNCLPTSGFRNLVGVPLACPGDGGMTRWQFLQEGADALFEATCTQYVRSSCRISAARSCWVPNNTGFADLSLRQGSSCGPGEYIAGWELGNCSGTNEVRFTTTCCTGPSLPFNYTESTSCYPLGRTEALEPLAQEGFAPACRDEEALQSVWWSTTGCESGEGRFTFVCLSNVDRPAPQPPVPGWCNVTGTSAPDTLTPTNSSSTDAPSTDAPVALGIPIPSTILPVTHLTGNPSSPSVTERPPAITPQTVEPKVAVGVSVVAGSMAVAFSSTPTVSIQTVVLRQVACAELSTDAEDDLDFIVHPLGFSIRGSQEAGAIVGNTLVAAAFALVFYLEAYVVWLMAPSNTKAAQTAQTQQHAEKAAVDDNTQAPLWTLACAIVRFPSVAYFPALFLLPGTLECSVTLLAEAGHDLLFLSLACVGVALCVGFPAHLFFQPNGTLTEAAVVEVEHVQKSGFGRARGAVARYILGKDAWVSTNEAVLYVERDGMLFDSYRELRWLKGRHFVIELAITYPLAALAFTQTRTFTTCSIKAFVLATLFLAQSVLMVYFDVFLSPFLQHLTLATNVTMTIGLMLLATAYLRESLLGTHFDTAIGFLTGAMVLALIRAVFDAFVFWHDIYCCWRKANRETSRPGLFSTLAFRATFRCKRLAERRSAPLQPSASDPSRKSSTRTGQSPSQSSEPSVSLNPLASQSAGKLARDDTEDGWDAHSAASGLSLETGVVPFLQSPLFGRSSTRWHLRSDLARTYGAPSTQPSQAGSLASPQLPRPGLVQRLLAEPAPP